MSTELLPTIQSPADLKKLPIESLPGLATEIRHAICEQVKKSGGHLAPNLGVVELMLALHYVFDFSHDRLLFDVGHQCYTHKLLTGRQNLLGKLRQRGGMSGFPSPDESPYDLFSVGHAGTSISTAVGMARGDTINGEAFEPTENTDGRRVVAFVGDASIVNGVAMEGLNNAGTLKRQFLIVLNDNNMSIANPQGAIADYFDHLRVGSTYRSMKKAAKNVMGKLPGGSMLEDMTHRMTEMMKDAIFEDSWFEHFGLLSIGPIDGHDIPSLIEMLIEVKEVDRPLLLHAHTIKGKGFEYTEQNATTFHSPKPFEVKNTSVEMQPSGRSFTAAFSDALCELMQKDEKIVAATAAMPDGTGIDKAIKQFPNRVWDTGICESHAMDMLAGMAKTGCKPFFALYSTFLQRAFDQVFQEVALQGLPVRLCIDRAGVVGGDGAVHHGFCDTALLRVLPNSVIMAAIDEPSLKAALTFMADYNDGLSAIRYPRDTVQLTDFECVPFKIGKAHKIRSCKSAKLAILGFGTTALAALAAADCVNPEAIDVYDARFAKPVDGELIEQLLKNNIPIITVEDHSIIGGFGSAVIEEANRRNLDTTLITTLGLPDHWICHSSRKEQLADAGIDVAGISAAALRIFCANKTESPLVVTN
ncbi:MAG TPA: 1-deoxy-D-xylulose-5-phosphate synthase [Phycisphaerales bacterium]|nr:1-deoxy-D-xylulose-5-phosphate synthase [Phycisphaerales bacterium]HIB51223.1 1-deoxy-D-xylulose-5-phosphate synthase [Phycisphaerales bacterium]HIN83575.1 1-deoxy-D-xylulose-5-phosphate synthase [Phycisphaerales bacterium]HIO20493.1 1-deoxy-D-xylulose-5-phosphate synthase [Phycisphaerales bacterium]